MMRSLYSGVAGLKTHQSKMDVIGNNIANVNTVGFKSTSVTFQDIMYQTNSKASGATDKTGGVNAKQTGLGVSTGSTKISIASGGAAQSTGEAFDIKLTDSQSTNFFIVSNGNENQFTRAGSFYLDGSGNLAMTSTGYLVQGWQAVTDTDGSVYIQKDKVSPLRIMQPSNLTSSPEATEEATVSGIIDKNDDSVTSNDGYYMSLGFYDNLGYLYTAKFAVNAYDTDAMEYTVSLQSIIDDNNNDILAEYVDGGGSVSDIFGTSSTSRQTFSLRAPQFNTDGNYIRYGTSEPYAYYNATTTAAADASQAGFYKNPVKLGTNPSGAALPDGATYDENTYGYYFNENADGSGAWTFVSISDMGAPSKVEGQDITDIIEGGGSVSFSLVNGDYVFSVEYPSTNYMLRFNTADGSFRDIGGQGNEAVNFNVQRLNDKGNFHQINVDFSQVINVDNGGSATAGMDVGSVKDPAIGAGKKLGALTSLAVQQNGMIFGSYDNGNTVLLGQIAVAQFTNPSGLEALGNNLYAQTLNSGTFDGIGVDVTADGGSMETGQLEMSNVDLSKEFTEMITTQRGFQANSRIITVSDTMLEELTNLKR